MNTDPGSQNTSSTQWSLIVAAGETGAAGAEALAALCRRYWPAVYAFIRGRVKSTEDAQDLTQEFFARFLERGAFARADPGRGKFRAFLFTSVRNFLSDEAESRRAVRRGGGVRVFSFDFSRYDSQPGFDPPGTESPESAFHRQWAQSLLAQTLDRMREEFQADGRLREFDLLLPYLSGPPPGEGHDSLARKLNVSEPAARQAASRFRKRYKSALRDEIAQTLAEPVPENIDAELRELFAAVQAAH
ncbi:MAG: sigma-70 family RNA polymerase sigma factor [Planctomycetota bacterium]|nr:sigma-70 family RNA polymerase sigma factor [Planctomycetota bacterium]